MMNNVNLPLALITVFFRKLCQKFQTTPNTLALRRPFWQKHLLYVTPCMYLTMFCLGLYYTYKQVDQRRNTLQLSRKSNRTLQLRDHIKRKKFIERNRIWFLRNLALGTSGREEVLKALNQLSTSKTRTKPGGPQVSPKREVLVQKRVPMKPNYSESTLSINSQTETLQESCSFINLHQRGSPMDLDREREYFYANLPTYSNFSGENEPNPIRSTPHIRELCTARASDSSIRTAVSCADQNQNINSELRKSVCKCCSKTNGVRKHMRRKLSPIQNANKKPRGRRPKNNKRNIAAVRETSLVRKTRSGKVYNSATLSMIGHQNLLQGVQKVQAIPNLQMSGR